MKPNTGTSRWLPLLASFTLFAGCDDGTAPVPEYDPQETLTRLEEVLDPLDASEDVFLGLDLASYTLSQYAGAPVGAVLTLSPRPALTAKLRPGAVQSPLAARVTSHDRSTILPRVSLPSSLVGHTLVWDTARLDYVVDPTATGAPTDGVRLVYYSMDTSTGYPSQPLTPLGVIDITDEDRTLTERVGVRVVTLAGEEVANYAVELDSSGGSSAGVLEYRAAGTLDSGVRTLEFDLVQRFNWSQSQNVDALLIDYLYTVDGHPVHFVVEAQAAFEAAAWDQLRFDVTFDPGASSVVEMEVGIGSNSALDGEVRVNNRRVIDVSGTDGDPIFRHVNRTLSQSEVFALEQIWIDISDVVALTEWVLAPTDILLMPG